MDAQPPRFLIRPATPADARAIAEVHVRTWQIAYVDFFSAEYLDRMSVLDREQAWLGILIDSTLLQPHVAEAGGSVVGSAGFGPNNDDLGEQVGELLSLYVDPDAWDRGVGGALIKAAEASLAHDFASAILWTLADNVRTRRFYETHGWTVDGATQVHSTGAPLVRYAKPLQQPTIDA